ncbi:glutathione peroxidase [Mucilaginibacter puniceus]
MKTLALIFSLMFATAFATAPDNVYTFKLKTLDNADFSLAKYKGKKILIVNTASKCGYTPQFEALQKLQDLYKDKLVVIGFPANNFANQEPGNAAEILACQAKNKASFLLTEKVSVKGADMAPLFQYLTTAANPDFTGEVKWNFEKFLVDENGKLIHRFRSAVEPTSEAITKYL